MHKKILNFRNIGNIQTKEGTIIPNYFYRGGPLHNLENETIQTLQNDLNIKTILDLRDNKEIENQPNHNDGFTIHHLNIIADQSMGSANPEELLKMIEDNPKEMMTQLYKNIINSKHSQSKYKEFFEIILESQEPVYFHCSAGKDRTGLGAAFLLKALGASNEDILQDYLLTNELSKDNIDHMIKLQSEVKPLTDQDIENVRALSGVHQEYIETAWNEIITNYDTFENYAEQAFGLTEDKIQALKKKFITKG